MKIELFGLEHESTQNTLYDLALTLEKVLIAKDIQKNDMFKHPEIELPVAFL
jgi:hypothetical protein